MVDFTPETKSRLRSLKPDKKYQYTDYDAAAIIAEHSASLGLDLMSKIKKSMSVKQIEQANKAIYGLSMVRSGTSAVKGVVDIATPLVRSGEMNASDVEMDQATYIKGGAKWAISNMSYLLPLAQKKLSEEDYEKYQEAVAGIAWITANMMNSKRYPGRYNKDALDQIGDVIVKTAELGLKIKNQQYPTGDKDIAEKLKTSFQIPPYMLFMCKFVDEILKLSTMASSALKLISTSIKNVGVATSKMMDWGDFKKNPLGTIINIMEGMMEYMGTGMNVLTSINSLISDDIALLAKGVGSKRNKKNESLSPTMLIGKVLANIGSLISSGLKGITSMFAAMIQSAFMMFSNIMMSIIKIAKQIAETSPMFKAICDYINLAINMFFMFFFTAFGEPLLNAVMSIYSIIVETGVSFIQSLQDADNEVVKDLTEILPKAVENIKLLITDFMLVLIDNFEGLIKPMLDFAKDFITVIINNSQNIMNLLTEGITAMTVMVEGNLIGAFLEMGSTVLDWMYKHAGFIRKIVKFVLKFIRSALFSAKSKLNEVILGFRIIIDIVGTLSGALNGAKVGSLIPGIGTLVGAGVGVVAGLIVSEKLGRDFVDKYFTAGREALDVSIRGLPDESKFAEGGKIRHTLGGHLGLMSEAGQGEYAIPESKIDSFRGDNNVILRFNKGVYEKRKIEPILKRIQNEFDFNYVFD